MNYATIKNYWWVWITLLLWSSCIPTKKLQKILPQQIEQSAIFQQSFTGFALLDPATGQFIYEYQSDKYFTPASNTKIFTFYTCLQLLEEMPPILLYEERGDTLIFAGTGNPYFLHPTLDSESIAFDFLQNTEKKLFFTSSNFQDSRYGSGWAWDDYPYSFQAEKSPLPIYGNVVRFEKDSGDIKLSVYPEFFKNRLQKNQMTAERARFQRAEFSNRFSHNSTALAKQNRYEKEIPFHYSDSLLVQLLSDTLGKEVKLWTSDFQFSEAKKSLPGYSTKQLYQQLLQESDNFVAEQLLLMCSHQLFEELNVKKVISFAKGRIFQDLPDELLWRDGSGLSRYNMFTPRSIVRLLEKIYRDLPESEIFDLFPTGGVSGTIQEWYGATEKPYVFAKTGTLSGKHCLSGYLKTKSGQTLIFSFMHNNFKTGSQPLKEEMETILRNLYEQF